MTMATETEKNGPAAETKDIKDVKEMKDALKDETPPDNKQDEASKESANEKKEEAEKKQQSEDGAKAAATDAAQTGAAGDASNAAASNAATAAAPAKAPSVHKPNFEKDVVYLYQFPRTPLLPSLSSYCLKVETWLRLNGIQYEVRFIPISYLLHIHAHPFFSSRGCMHAYMPRLFYRPDFTRDLSRFIRDGSILCLCRVCYIRACVYVY